MNIKRIIFILIISFSILVTVATIAIGLEYLGVISEETSYISATPFRVPVYIYEDILGFEPPSFEEENELTARHVWLFLYVILFDVILYGIIIYFIIGLFAKLKRGQETIQNDEPPEPPVFN